MAAITKYAGLPDIDTAADVYETEDTPVISRGQNDSDSDDSLLRLRAITKPSSTDPRKRGDAEPGTVDGSSLVPGKDKVRQVFGRRERSRNGTINDAYTSRPRLPPISQRLAPRHAPTRHLTDSAGESTTSEDDDDQDDANYLTARTASLRIRETPHARLRRLKWEMQQLEKELRAGPGEDSPRGQDAADGDGSGATKGRRKAQPPTAELLKQLAGLQSHAEGLEEPAASRVRGTVHPVARAVREIVDGLSRASEGDSVRDVEGQEVQMGALGSEGHDAAELDKRLDVLEKRIGTGTVDETTLNQPILQSLQKLENVLGLLAQPRQLDAASRKVKLLLADLGKVSALATGAGATGIRGTTVPPSTTTPASTTSLHVSLADKEKLDTLYALVPRLDPLLPILPPLLTRLRSLATLHANASSFHATLGTLEAQTAEMERTGVEMKSVLERVEQGLERNAQGVQSNWESLEARLGDVMGRLEALEER